MDTTVAGKNVWFVATSNLIISIFTYVFWFVSARLFGATTLGEATAVVSLSVILATVSVVDVSLGMKRTLSLSFISNDLSKFKQMLSISLIFVTLTSVTISFIILLPQLHILESLNIPERYGPIAACLILTMSLQFVLSEALVSAMSSRSLVLSSLIGSLIRFPLLVIIGYGFSAPTTGTMIAYASMLLLTTASFAISIWKITRTHRTIFANFFSNLRDLLSASLSSWIPHMMNVLGMQLGIMSVLTQIGTSEVSKFYIAIGILSVMLTIALSFSRVTHSFVPMIKEESTQNTFLSMAIKLALAFTMPLAIPLMFFSAQYLSIMGPSFSTASGALSILMASLPFAIFHETFYYFVYGKGEHKTLLIIGCAGNLPRIFLYFIFTPTFGLDGASLAYLTGSIIQVISSLIVIKRYKVSLPYLQYVLLSVIPIPVALLVYLVHLPFLLGSMIIIVASFIVYIKLHLLTKAEIESLIQIIFPKRTDSRSRVLLSKLLSFFD